MLSILADALLVATRFDSASALPKRPATAWHKDREPAETIAPKRNWAQRAGLIR